MTSKVLKAGIGYTIGNYLLKGLSFFSIPIFVRLMSVSDYGRYNTFVAYEAIMTIFLGLAIHSSLKNARYKYGLFCECRDAGGSYENYLSTSLLLIVSMTFLAFVVVLFWGEKFSNYLDLPFPFLLCLIAFSFGNAVVLCFNVDASLQYRFQSFLKIAFVNAFSSIGLSIFLIKTFCAADPCWGRVLGTTIPMFVIGVLILIFYWKRTLPKKIFSKLKWGVLYSLPIIPHGLSQIILSQFNRIMINFMIGPAVAGIYSFAYNVYLIGFLSTQAIDNVWSPWFYEKMASKDKVAIKEKSSMLITLVTLFFVALIIAGPEIIYILGPSEYMDAKYAVIPIVAGGFFAFLYNLPAAVEYYNEKTKFIALATCAAAVLNIVLNYVFIPLYGYISAAYSTLVTYVLYFLFHFFMAKFIQKENLFDLRVMACSCAEILVIMVASRFFLSDILIRYAILLVVTMVTFVRYKKEIVSFLFAKGDCTCRR